jgi:hypothetical protein
MSLPNMKEAGYPRLLLFLLNSLDIPGSSQCRRLCLLNWQEGSLDQPVKKEPQSLEFDNRREWMYN